MTADRFLRAALAYAELGWAVFPLIPGKKEPAIKTGLKAASREPDQIRAWWKQEPRYNIGIRTGQASNIVVLDVDTKNGDGFASLAQLVNLHGALPTTPWQWTGNAPLGRGKQFVFQWFEGAKNTNGDAGGIAPSIDTRGDGGYIVAAPSLHPSGVHYEWGARPSQCIVAPSPEWLVAWFRDRDAKRNRVSLEPVSTPDWAQVSDKYVRAALEREFADMAGQGKGGRNTRLNEGGFALGQLVGAGVLPRSEAERCVRDAARANGWAQEAGAPALEAMIRSAIEAGLAKPRTPPEARAQPERARREVRLVHSSASATSSAPSAATASPASPTNSAGPASMDGNAAVAVSPASRQDWRDDLLHNQDGGLAKQSFHNAVLILQNEPAVAGLFAFDEFSGCIVVTQRPPWCLNGFEPGPLTDPDIAGCRLWLERHHAKLSKNDAFGAIEYVAAQRHLHPVRDYLRSLQWDGHIRLSSWLSDYLGAAASAFHSVAGSKWMIGAVARVMQPGCKVDTMLILEGPQGLKKSAALRTLAQMGGRDFFTDELASLGSKDAAQQLQGNLVIEMAELDALDRAEIKTIKAFLTRQVDKVRLPYARTVSSLRRQCVFAGTVNPDGSGYLRDPTGGRRFWPVPVTAIDIEALREARDQIWAEAVARYDEGESWWIQEADVLTEAKAAQDARREEDPLTDLLVDYVRAHHTHGVTCAQVLANAWSFDERYRTPAAGRRAGAALRALGWEDRLVRDKGGGKPQRRFYPPGHDALANHPRRSDL